MTEYNLEKKKKGFSAVSDKKTIFLPNAELMNIGCKNCVWKLHGQCPHKLVDDEIYEDKLIHGNEDKCFWCAYSIQEKEDKLISLCVHDKNNPRKIDSSHLNEKKPEWCPLPTSSMKGICNELIQFVLSLASKDDSASALWEKFHIYKARIQESEDYKDFLRLEKEIKKLELTAIKEEDMKLLDKLKMDKTAAKIWWSRLNETVVKQLSKIVDRESKGKEGVKLPGIMSAKTINFNMTKQVEDKSK